MKKKLLILPGALGTSKTMKPLADYLAKDFDILSFDYLPLQITLNKEETYVKKFAKDVMQYLENNKIDSVLLFGYSFGGLVALQTALYAPQKIEAIYSYGTIWQWNETVAQHVLKFMNPDIIAEKLPHYSALLQEWYGVDDWRMIVQEEIKRTVFLGKNPAFQEADFSKVSIPVHYRIGADDRIAFRAFIEWAFKHTIQASFGLIPNSAHPVAQINLAYLRKDMEEFLNLGNDA